MMLTELQKKAAFETILDIIAKQMALKRQEEALVKDFKERFGVRDIDYADEYFKRGRK